MKNITKKVICVILAFSILASSVILENIPAKNTAYAATVSGYTSEGIAFYASATAKENFTPVYRLYKALTTDHIYTVSEEEKTSQVTNFGYALEPASTTGIALYAYPQNTPSETVVTEGLVPIFRIYSKSIGGRLYTASATEKDDFIANLSFALDPFGEDGIAFYAYPNTLTQETITQKSLVPVYRFHNEATGDYVLTNSEDEKTTLLTEDPNPPTPPVLGPEISVGLWNTSKASLATTSFKIKANKNYNIKDAEGNILAQVTASTITRVGSHTVTTITYQKESHSSKKKKKKKKKKKHSHKKKKKTSWFQEFIAPTTLAADKQIITNTEYLKIFDSIPEKKLSVQEIYFDATDGNNSDMIFDIYRPESTNDQYRGKIKIKYTDDDNIWMINVLPLEQYVWGMGETTGTGPKEHTKVMTVIFRTYGLWYTQNATKYLPYGFRIRSDSGSQIYYGYDWEKNHLTIKQSSDETKGKVATYQSETALTPYSSWTDGRTRSFEEHWGSKEYPWCLSVLDPYGKHATQSTETLVASGNHMVGLSAHGSLKLADSDYKWDYAKILKYYYTGIDLTSKY